MTDVATTSRVYVIAVTLLVFVLLWTAVSAAPLPPSQQRATKAPLVAPGDPRVAALEERRRALVIRQRSVELQVKARWARYERQRAQRLQRIDELLRTNSTAARAFPAAPSSAVPSVNIQAPRASTPAPSTSTRSS